MIQANELRIGNWALYPHTIHEPFQITEPRHIELAYLLKPIPLTPEILEACGFEVITDWTADDVRTYDCTHFLDLKFLYIGRNMLGGITLFQNDNISTGIHFDHLHVLQNFIFAVTGTELSINLEKVKA